MKYKNTTPNNIFAKVNGRTVIVAPNEEVISEILLPNSGLTPAVPPVVAPKVTEVVSPKPTKVESSKPAKKSTNKSVNTNEFTTTNKTKD